MTATECCGVVILYHPDKAVVNRLATYRHAVKTLFLVDNSPQENSGLIGDMLDDDGVVYLHDGRNEGIARRLNQAALLARDTGCTWLLTMDQDSWFVAGTLHRYLDCVAGFERKEKVAMFGLEHDERHLSNGEHCSFSAVKHLITSGSVVNLSVMTAIGGFDEALFIDHVDHEYCFRALQRGYQVIKCDNILLRHQIGDTSQHRSLRSGKRTPRSLHSPVRIYYMVRNFFYLRKKYHSEFPAEIQFLRANLLNRFKNNLLYNPKRWQVFRFILKGFADYRQNKMGKVD